MCAPFYRPINVNEISKHFTAKRFGSRILLNVYLLRSLRFVSKNIDIFLSQQLWLSEANDIFTLNVNLAVSDAPASDWEKRKMPTTVNDACARIWCMRRYQCDAYINEMSKTHADKQITWIFAWSLFFVLFYSGFFPRISRRVDENGI